MNTSIDALKKAIAIVGGPSALARELGYPWPSTVTNWIGRDGVPAERCLDVERITAGAVTRYDLRPDVFGPAPASEAA